MDKQLEKINNIISQIDSNLNSIEVKGNSVLFLFQARLEFQELVKFLNESVIKKEETEEEKLNKEV